MLQPVLWLGTTSRSRTNVEQNEALVGSASLRRRTISKRQLKGQNETFTGRSTFLAKRAFPALLRFRLHSPNYAPPTQHWLKQPVPPAVALPARQSPRRFFAPHHSRPARGLFAVTPAELLKALLGGTGCFNQCCGWERRHGRGQTLNRTKRS